MIQSGADAGSAGGMSLPGGICGSTYIETVQGPAQLSDLRAGDLIHTRDNGPRPMIALHTVGPDRLQAGGVVTLRPPLLGATGVMSLCGDQRLALGGWLVAALFSRPEILARLSAILPGDADPVPAAFHLPVFAAPQLLCCAGIWLACPGADGALPLPQLSEDEERSIAGAGFARRLTGARPPQPLPEMHHA